MLSFLTTRLPGLLRGQKLEDVPAALASAMNDVMADVMPSTEESTILRTVAWVSAGLGAVALGLFVGAELRQRYKFNRRTPYDHYAHSGDEQNPDFGEMEFGVGV